ncbi:class I SAM-dependent methyltransferase [Methylocystis suflitae]|uniref:class I SAM-dependent methyltransferase n=1 Tax=Methylocystis suflitae TaxID=2951405 RepID=UPI00210E9ACA|nr:class I SAM-dependent methyltransferase [Methylocystis suflitae]MCQ4190963.1 class I SAM-dependent methyltransferase [Methylocystis suflitae]
MNVRFSSINAIKADFSDIYASDDPRDYFKVLGKLNYVIPQLAAPVLLQLAERLIEIKGRPITILDVGCSYGLLSATARLGLSISQLCARYEAEPIQALDPQRLASFDAKYFASWPKRPDIRFIGLDCSPQAISYALTVGLIEKGLVIDLETNAPDGNARSLISQADLIISTGAVGYISEKTFSKLLQAFPAGKSAWVASFVLRMFDYAKIAKTLHEHGLETERLNDVTFVQRRFQDRSELCSAIDLIKSRGLDPSGKEDEGFYHAELFLSRPTNEVRKASLSRIVSVDCDNAAEQLLEIASNEFHRDLH